MIGTKSQIVTSFFLGLDEYASSQDGASASDGRLLYVACRR